MAEVNNFKTSKRKKPLDIQYVDSVSHRPSDLAIPSARKSKGGGGAVQSCEMKTDDELECMIPRVASTILTLGPKLPDKGAKLKALLRRCVSEVQRRKRRRFVKDERDEEDDDEVKRMGRERDEPEAEKKLIDAETKIVQLEAHVLHLEKKLRDSTVQLDASEDEKKELEKRLDVAERKCASVADDGKWLLHEGLPLLVKKLVNELSKDNFSTVSDLRTLHQRSMSDSS